MYVVWLCTEEHTSSAMVLACSTSISPARAISYSKGEHWVTESIAEPRERGVILAYLGCDNHVHGSPEVTKTPARNDVIR